MQRQNANFFEQLEEKRREYITGILRCCRKRGVGLLYSFLFYLAAATTVLLEVLLLIQVVMGNLPYVLVIIWLLPVGLAAYTFHFLSLHEDSGLSNQIASQAVAYISGNQQSYIRELATNSRILIYLVETNAFREVKPFTDSQDQVTRYLLFREKSCQYLIINLQNIRPQTVEKLQVDIPVFGGLRIEGEIVDRMLQYPGPYVGNTEEQHLLFDAMENIEKYMDGTEVVNRQLVAYLLNQMRLDRIEECVRLPVRTVSDKLEQADLENREQTLGIIGAVQQRITVANIRTDLLNEIQRQFYDGQSGYTVCVPYGLFMYYISFNNASEVAFNNEANVNQMINSVQQTLTEMMGLLSGRLALASATTETQSLFHTVLMQNIYKPRAEDILGETTTRQLNARTGPAEENHHMDNHQNTGKREESPRTAAQKRQELPWEKQKLPWERDALEQPEAKQSVKDYVLSGRYLVRGQNCPADRVWMGFLNDMMKHFHKTEDQLDMEAFEFWLNNAPALQRL